MINFTVNGKAVQIEVTDDTPLLWVLRDILNLTGTKFGSVSALAGRAVFISTAEPSIHA